MDIYMYVIFGLRFTFLFSSQYLTESNCACFDYRKCTIAL